MNFLGALPSCAKERSIRPVLYMALLQAEAAALNTTRLIKDAAIAIPISENTSTNGLIIWIQAIPWIDGHNDKKENLR